MKFRNGIIIILLLMALVSIPISFASDLDADIDSNQLYDNDLVIDQELDEDIVSDSDSNGYNEESAVFNENIQASDDEYGEGSQYEVLSDAGENLLSDSSGHDGNVLPDLDTDFANPEINCNDSNTIYVNASYTGSEQYGTKLNPFKSIADGFDHLSAYGISNIFIAKGTYSITNKLHVSKSINIIGEDSKNTIVDGLNQTQLLYISSKNIVVNIINLTFTKGSNQKGGSIYNWYSCLNIINSIFKNNYINSSSLSEGGVIYNYAGYIKIYNSTFLNNSLYGLNNKFGAVINNNLGELSIFNTKFINNSINGRYSTGGVIFSYKGFLTLFNSSISNTLLNSTNNSLGGAISIWDGRYTYIINSTISSNTIKGNFVYGSAIAHKGVLLEIINSTISNNYANGTSAANSTVYNMNGNYHFENTNFTNNGIKTVNSNILSCLEDQLIISNIADVDLLGDLPSSYDLRDLGLVTSVKNQGSNGDCWAFAIYAALESYLLKFENITYDFSENNMKNAMYENGTYGTEENESGGNHIMAFAYLLRGSGPVNESLDPYSSFIPLEGLDIEKYITGFKYIPLRLNYLDNDQIKYAILQYGALYAPIYSTMLRNNGTGYSNIPNNNNHAVAIVGWDDNYPASSFDPVPPGDGAWIIKNSWGDTKGDGGYYYVSYYDSTFPGVTDQFAAIAISSVENLTEYKSIYQYDMLGNSYESVGYNSNTAWYANQFTAESNNPIKAFGLYTFGSSSYLVNITVNGVSKLVQEGNLTGAGYHTVKLDQFVDVAKGNIFKIAVKLTTPDSLFPVAVESKRSDYSTKVTAEPNQSFISPDGVNWYDIGKNLTVTKFYKNVSRIKLCETNVCLKAYTGFADLSLDIKTNFSYYLEGDAIQFNITVSNKADPSGEINISSLLDDSVTVLSQTVNKGIFDESNGLWVIDNLNAGESAKLVLTLKFNEKKAAVINSFSLKSLSYSLHKNLVKDSVVEYATHTEFLKIASVNTTVKSGKSVTITLIDGYNNILANKSLTLKLISSSNNYTMNPLALNTNNGSVEYALNLLAGKYKFMLSFESDGYYDSSNCTFDVNVVKTSTNVVASNMNASTVVKAIDGNIGKYLKMTLKDANGNVLKSKTVVFTLNATKYTLKTNTFGVASLQINIAKAGTYSFKISFAGDEKLSASSKTVKVYIKKQTLKMTVPNKTFRVRNKNKYLTATLKNSKGKVIKNKKITFTINGKKYTAKTNSKGIAKVKVSLSKRKTYKFTAKFACDKSYKAVSKTAKVVVKR